MVSELSKTFWLEFIVHIQSIHRHATIYFICLLFIEDNESVIVEENKESFQNPIKLLNCTPSQILLFTYVRRLGGKSYDFKHRWINFFFFFNMEIRL